MATPQAAVPRDLEQRIRNIESTLRQITSATLRQRQLSVTEGDFVVSGGGNVLVRDGGNINGTYPDNSPALVFGRGLSNTSGHDYVRGIEVRKPDGIELFMVRYFGNDDGSNPTSDIVLGPDSVLIDADVQINVTQYGSISAPDGGGTLYVDSGGFKFGPSVVSFQGIATTGSGANTYIDPTTGRLLRSTSSRRYKENIGPADIDPATLLQLVPVVYTRKDEASEPAPRHYVGFIAEDADALGLTEFVEYDTDGRPESFSYALWSAALQAICRAQQSQLDAQAQQIADLTARLDALESRVGA